MTLGKAAVESSTNAEPPFVLLHVPFDKRAVRFGKRLGCGSQTVLHEMAQSGMEDGIVAQSQLAVVIRRERSGAPSQSAGDRRPGDRPGGGEAK